MHAVENHIKGHSEDENATCIAQHVGFKQS